MKRHTAIRLFFLSALLSARADVCTWTGTWDIMPDSADDQVILQGGGNLSWTNGMPATVASWSQKATYTGTVTFETRCPGQGEFTTFTIVGDCVVAGGTWTHLPQKTVQTNRLGISVGGGFSLEAGASLNADGRGFSSGPGCSYGGKSGLQGSRTYGSITSPMDPGSGMNSRTGGGVIWLNVRGRSAIDGVVSCNGRANNDVNQCGASGGSLFLTTGTLTGNGTLRANGGWGSGRGGGGGRVAVILNDGADFGNVRMTACGNGPGGTGGGAAGTVYRETSTQPAGRGELIVDNNGLRTLPGVTTDLNGSAPVAHEFSILTLTNAGVLGIGPDDSLDLTQSAVRGSAADDGDGIRLFGGTLAVSPSLVLRDYFIAVSATGTTFDPVTSLTVGTNATLIIDKRHAVSGDVTVEPGGRITHDANRNAELYKVDLAIGGDLDIRAGAVVNVDGRGYGADGPGTSAHGGRAGKRGAATHGSVTRPTRLGSNGNGGTGGGAVRLNVAGDTTLNGIISADGRDTRDHWQVGGAGGSVWLTTASLAGRGTIRARGGHGRASGGGGGGRIAVDLTSGNRFGDVVMTAGGQPVGAPRRGGSGTISRRWPDAGDVVIDGGGRAPSGGTDLPAVQVGGDTVDSLDGCMVVATNGAEIMLSADLVVRALVVASAGERVDLGQPDNTLTTYMLEVNGAVYDPGTYTTNDWNGLPAPPNVRGNGRIVVKPPGTAFFLW